MTDEQDWLITQVGAAAECLWQAAPWNGTCVGHSFSQLVHRNDFDILNTSYTMAPPNSTHIPGCTVRVATFAFETLGPRHIRVCRYQTFEMQFLTFAASQTGRSVVMVGTALPTHNSHLFPANATLTQVDQLFDMQHLRQSGGIFEYCGEPLMLGQVSEALSHTGEFSSEEVSFLQRYTNLTGLPSLYRRAMYYWWAKLFSVHIAFVFDDNDMPHIRGHLRLRLQSPLGEWQTPWRLLSHHCLNGTPLRFRNRTEAPIFHMLSVLVGDGGDEDEEEVLRFARFHLIPRSGTFPDAHLFPKIPEQNSWLSPRQLSGNCYMPHQVQSVMLIAVMRL
mmetsp:Transcript_44399/g.65084  ORF Transcript_44399/g.65084 Transcript_44399/m.65084 type:complete len:334 (-) Transcript_44399:403-1404(-)